MLRHAARAREVPELALHLREPVHGLEAEAAAEGAGLAVRRAAAIAAVHAMRNLSAKLLMNSTSSTKMMK